MAKRWKGFAAAALTGSLALGIIGTSYGAPLALAGFGADQKAETKVQAETKKEAAQTAPAAAETAESPAAVQTEAQTEALTEVQTEAQTEVQTEAQTEPPVDRSMVDTTGFAKADDYINVRASGDTEGEVVGTLHLNDSVYIEDVDENGWYKVRSGNVEGYVAGYLIATGEEAEEVARNAGYTYAQVGAESLNVRADASEDAEVVDMVGQNADLEVVEDLGDWVKVVTGNGVYGYVSANYVNTQTVYPTGETVQEQSEREEQEYLAAVARQEAEYEAYLAQQEAEYAAYLAQQEAEAAAAGADAAYTDTTYTDTTYTDTSYTDAAYTDTSAVTAASGDVDALYQAYLTAQEAAMHVTDEADAVAKANAAIEAYNAYLAACGSTQSVESVTAAETTATADTTAAAAATDSTAADTTGTQTGAEQTPQTEAQTEAPVSTSEGSGAGAQVAAFATQFVGNPYVYGGASLTGGADCSGFTMAVYSNFGVGLPHNAAAQSGCGTPVSLSDLQPGDLLFYDNGGGIGHVALYIGGGQVVHASNPESGIKISSYNYRSPVAATRLV